VSPMASAADKAIARANLKAANAIEDLIDQNLQKTNPGLLENYRQARKQIAQSIDVEKAMNPSTGDVSGRKLGSLLDKGRPLTGALKEAAKSAKAFPKSNQDMTFGGTPAFSPLDVGVSAIGGRHMEVLGAIAGRPIARRMAMSEMSQRSLRPEYGLPLSMKLAEKIPEVSPLMLANEAGQQ